MSNAIFVYTLKDVVFVIVLAIILLVLIAAGVAALIRSIKRKLHERRKRAALKFVMGRPR